MFPADFTYARAESLEHALSLLDEAQADGEEAKLLAGGQSLLPLMKLRLAAPETLVDIGGLTELKGVTTDVGSITIKALTTYRALQRDPHVIASLPAMTDALAVLADQQVRARGTIGGCVAHGDPAADLPAVLLALDAKVTLTSTSGTRTIAPRQLPAGRLRHRPGRRRDPHRDHPARRDGRRLGLREVRAARQPPAARRGVRRRHDS